MAQDKQDFHPKSWTSASGPSNLSARACEIQKALRKVESNAKLVGLVEQVRISPIFSIKQTATACFIHGKGIPTIHSDSMVSHSEQFYCSAFFTSPRGTSRGDSVPSGHQPESSAINALVVRHGYLQEHTDDSVSPFFAGFCHLSIFTVCTHRDVSLQFFRGRRQGRQPLNKYKIIYIYIHTYIYMYVCM